MTLEDYVDMTPLNQGGFGRTYRARHQTGGVVCIKEFRFGTRRGENDSFKALEMFQREAEILKSLKHPQIPEFKDYFVNTSESGEETYYIV
ncbi:serine/threonine protein kinase, partial [Candidatus Woesearchaeota archaeon]|nr:serine/threonine protein kinase [Candidatus Woesearchaeota archaeon]